MFDKRWALLFIPAVLLLAGCASKVESKSPPPAPMVEVTDVVPTTADIYTEYPGQTYARNMVDVRGRVRAISRSGSSVPGRK